MHYKGDINVFEKKILIIANTYYQLIVAIQMKLCNFKNDYVTLLLSDHSKGAKNIQKRLKNCHIFDDCYYIETKDFFLKRTLLDKFEDFVNISFGLNNRFTHNVNKIESEYYDELVFFNFTYSIDGLFSMLYRNNRNLKLSLFEEGFLSYKTRLDFNYKRKIIKFVRHLRNQQDVSDVLHNFYCFYPQLYHGKLTPIKVPVITVGDDCSKLLSEIFNISQKELNYQQRYIFFTSVYDFEGGEPIGEYKLVEKVAEVVGKENLLIKTHPRDVRTIYENNGFIVDKNSSIPWEPIQISGDFSDKVFMTATSGSVLAGSFMSEKPTKTFYMYRLCDISKNESAKHTAKQIYNLLQDQSVKSVLNKVKIIDTLEEISV